MARLNPEQAAKTERGFKGATRRPHAQTWRNAPSVVGRGQWRCGICQNVLDRDDEVVTYEGENCHVECAKADEESGGYG